MTRARRALLAGAATAAVALSAGCAPASPPPPPAPIPDPVPVEAEPEPAPEPVVPAGPLRRIMPVRLAFVGDINLGTRTLPDGIPPNEGRGLFDAVDSLLTGDLVVGNFEGAISDTGTSEKCERSRRAVEQRMQRARRAARDSALAQLRCYAFATPSALAPRLRDAGFTHLNLANNHANDMGTAGRELTARVFDSLGLRHYGPLGRIAIDTVQRGDSLTIVGLIGFATYGYAYDLLDLERTRVVVDSVRPLVDVLVVTFHGGAEGALAGTTPDSMEYLGREPRGHLRRWARVALDAGADAVVGHGPHVLRGVEFHGGKPIVYSLGNFLTYRGFSLAPPLHLTTVLQLELAADGRFLGGRLVPAVQRSRAGPAPDPEGAALEFIRARTGEDFPTTGARIDEDGRFGPREE